MFYELQLRKIRLREQEKLNEKNSCLYKNMTAHIKNSSLTQYEKEEVLQQIMDMMLQAQEESKSIDIFIGNDYEVFCKSIIEEINNSKNTGYKILNYLQKYLTCMMLTAIMMSIGNFITKHSVPLSITADQFMLASAVSIFILPFFHNRNREEMYVPINEKINFKINMVNKNHPFFIVLLIIFFIRFAIVKMFGSGILNYDFTLHESIYAILFISVTIVLIETYKRTCNRG